MAKIADTKSTIPEEIQDLIDRTVTISAGWDKVALIFPSKQKAAQFAELLAVADAHVLNVELAKNLPYNYCVSSTSSADCRLQYKEVCPVNVATFIQLYSLNLFTSHECKEMAHANSLNVAKQMRKKALEIYGGNTNHEPE